MATTVILTIKKDLLMYPAIDGTIMLCDDRDELIKLACYLNYKSTEIMSEVMSEMLKELQELQDANRT
jgi:hypothetical protein